MAESKTRSHDRQGSIYVLREKYIYVEENPTTLIFSLVGKKNMEAKTVRFEVQHQNHEEFAEIFDEKEASGGLRDVEKL